MDRCIVPWILQCSRIIYHIFFYNSHVYQVKLGFCEDSLRFPGMIRNSPFPLTFTWFLSNMNDRSLKDLIYPTLCVHDLFIATLFILLPSSANVPCSRIDKILSIYNYFIVRTSKILLQIGKIKASTNLRARDDYCVASRYIFFFMSRPTCFVWECIYLIICPVVQICGNRQAVKETFRVPDFTFFQWKRKCEIATHCENASYESRVNGKRQKKGKKRARMLNYGTIAMQLKSTSRFRSQCKVQIKRTTNPWHEQENGYSRKIHAQITLNIINITNR